jgi:hypothetical protein
VNPLFAGEDDLLAAQRDTRRRAAEFAKPTPEQERREFIDDQRELRMQARVRQFSFLLFVLPAIFSALALILSIAGLLLR